MCNRAMPGTICCPPDLLCTHKHGGHIIEHSIALQPCNTRQLGSAACTTLPKKLWILSKNEQAKNTWLPLNEANKQTNKKRILDCPILTKIEKCSAYSKPGLTSVNHLLAVVGIWVSSIQPPAHVLECGCMLWRPMISSAPESESKNHLDQHELQ